MPEGKKDEDIVGRLEALRKKVPGEKKGAPAPAAPAPPTPPETPEEPDKRKKLARIVGIVVILVIVGVVATVALKMFTAGKEEDGAKMADAQKAAAEAQKAAAEAQKAAAERRAAEAKLAAEKAAKLKAAKLNKSKEVREAFKGTPPVMSPEKQKVLDLIESAKTIEDIEVIDADAALDDAWDVVTNALRGEVKTVAETKAAEFEAIGMKVGREPYSGLDVIKRQIDQLSYDELNDVYFFEIGIEYVPIQLSREQFTGGFVEVGDSINIHYINESRQEYLAKDGKVMAIMRAGTVSSEEGRSSGDIFLEEKETKEDSGEGTEAKGTISDLTVGSLTVSPTKTDKFFDASAGYKFRTTDSTYEVDIAEIQKAAAASKIPESYIKSSLEKYGVRLNTIERETNIGDFEVEYLMLVEMDEIEASKVVTKLIDTVEKNKLLATISKPKSASWMENIG